MFPFILMYRHYHNTSWIYQSIIRRLPPQKIQHECNTDSEAHCWSLSDWWIAITRIYPHVPGCSICWGNDSVQ